MSAQLTPEEQKRAFYVAQTLGGADKALHLATEGILKHTYQIRAYAGQAKRQFIGN